VDCLAAAAGWLLVAAGWLASCLAACWATACWAVGGAGYY